MLDAEKTLEIIKKLKTNQIGDKKIWESMEDKIYKGIELDNKDQKYFSELTRIYKNATGTKRSKIFHVKLSKEDEKPQCIMCDEKSQYYCNMNDAYYCTIHVVGHDENEL